MYELACGDRRIDILFVRPMDLIGVELKSGTDSLGRLHGQALAYNNWFPEWWLAIAPRWAERWEVAAKHEMRRSGLLVVDSQGKLTQTRMAGRDELVLMRTLEWLWGSELQAVAERIDVWPAARRYRADKEKLKAMLARLLSGNQIMAEVCRELRARPRGMVGAGSDPPVVTKP